MKFTRRCSVLALVSLTITTILYYYSDSTKKQLKAEVKPKALSKLQQLPSKIALTKVRFISDQTKHFPLACKKYECLMEHAAETSTAALNVFNVKNVDRFQVPPQRHTGELWAFRSTEPQWLHLESPTKWDGIFNYSLTYLTSTEDAYYSFADKLVKKLVTTNFNFASEKNKREAKALWFVSHCTQPNRAKISSARIEYTLELSKSMPIDVFTRKESCRQQLGSLVKPEDPKHPPLLKNYTFYLAFENSLCKDYVTEKLWKVLEAETYTIPVVLGGLSIEEYTKVAPPNSFIHVKNFTSPKALADHLKYVAENDGAFNYYLQWRNEFQLEEKGMFTGQLCRLCELAHERPEGRWDTFSKDFGSHNCQDVSAPSDYCAYYNLSCNKIS